MPAQGPFRDRGAAAFQLIETMRREPGGGILRHGRHLARLERSAMALGFRFERHMVERALVLAGDGALRVRLTLDADGQISVSTQPFTALPPDAVWTVAIASNRLDSRDQLLRHKTTRRQAYDAARAERMASEVAEMLLLNERGELCEGTITSVFSDLGDGRLATPPLDCGLLEGVLRSELLDSGKAYERVLHPTDLAVAKSLFVGNSLRGLIPARLVGQDRST